LRNLVNVDVGGKKDEDDAGVGRPDTMVPTIPKVPLIGSLLSPELQDRSTVHGGMLPQNCLMYLCPELVVLGFRHVAPAVYRPGPGAIVASLRVLWSTWDSENDKIPRSWPRTLRVSDNVYSASFRVYSCGFGKGLVHWH